MTSEAMAGGEGAPRAILVIDDHPLFCEAISMALKAGLGLESVATANTLTDGMARLAEGLEVDAVALDLNLPDVEGIDGLVRLRAATPRTPVVVVSGLTDDRIVAQALRAGAAGFVRKDTPGDALVGAFRQVLEGEVYLPPDFTPPAAGDGAEAALDDAVGRLTELTPQQLRILSLVCAGKLNKQIAFDLGIAETTVKAHITAILRKLGVHSRTQAVLIAQKASYAGILKA
ncbi:response regulator transcription factor [Rubrimonas sp.]|uniref:response regulator transcription factor n=1 Tax=Rubrimonas sp. TaxID=2036015 RepID=UPI002FDC95A3